MQQAAAQLAEAGVPSARNDARLLLEHAGATGADPEALLARRAARVPLQHLIGTTGFRYLELAVGPGVFVPRPESELLVDAVLSAISELKSPRVVDLCAGSGAIGLSVAHEHPTVEVDLVEASAGALAWLRRNAGSHPRVRIHHGDLAEVPTDADGAVDVVVSNPPYVANHERELVDPEVRDHDPQEALWAGDDGLDVIRWVIERATVLLRPGGSVVIEHSDRQGEAVPALLAAAGFDRAADHLDLTGRPRYATAQWRPGARG